MKRVLKVAAWGIQNPTTGDLYTAMGNWIAPRIFSHRDQARKLAREFRDADFPARVVRVHFISDTVIVTVKKRS